MASFSSIGQSADPINRLHETVIRPMDIAWNHINIAIVHSGKIIKDVNVHVRIIRSEQYRKIANMLRAVTLACSLRWIRGLLRTLIKFKLRQLVPKCFGQIHQVEKSNGIPKQSQ